MPQDGNSSRSGPRRLLDALLGRRAPPPAPPPGPLAPLRPLLALDQLAQGSRSEAEAAIRALATTVPLGEDMLLCRVLGRYKMLVDAADPAHAPHLALDGFWEWWTTAFLLRTLKPGARVIDAGAGYGYFTLLAAELVGPTGRVLAIEPHPRSAELLRRNVTLNGFDDRVEVVQAALAGPAAPLILPLLVPPGGALAARLGRTAAPEEGIPVPVRMLDEHAALRPDLVKLDLGQGEAAAWEGMQLLLAQSPAVGVLFSFSAAGCEAPEALLRALAAHFPLRRLTPAGEVEDAGIAALLAGGDAMLWLQR